MILGVRRRRRGPVILGIAGDSASGKTTLARGLVTALGATRCATISTDDYHRFDRDERSGLTLPDATYVDILGQHLQLLATGQSILKPVYDHTSGRLTRPELMEPTEFVIVEGRMALYSRAVRACYDVTVFVEPAHDVCGQQAHADVLARFARIEGRDETLPSVTLLLRDTIRQPDLASVLRPEITRTVHRRAERDAGGRLVDSLHVHGYTGVEEGRLAEKILWHGLNLGGDVPNCLGDVAGVHSTPLAVTQMMLLAALFDAAR